MCAFSFSAPGGPGDGGMTGDWSRFSFTFFEDDDDDAQWAGDHGPYSWGDAFSDVKLFVGERYVFLFLFLSFFFWCRIWPLFFLMLQGLVLTGLGGIASRNSSCLRAEETGERAAPLRFRICVAVRLRDFCIVFFINGA